MVLKLRLARVKGPGGSKRHHPRYNIVLAQARTARDSKPLEVLGTYNPIPELPPDAPPGARKVKDIKVDVSRTKYWLGVGAQPSDTVWRLLSMIGLLEPKYLPSGPQTDRALKAVRFPTHIKPQPSVAEEAARAWKQSTVQATKVAKSTRADAMTATMDGGPSSGSVADTISPQNPSAA